MNESRWKNRATFHAAIRLVVLALLVVACSATSAFNVNRQGGTPKHKVQLTQKGYIQFLRWELPVPEFTEFTFCLWIKSNDLTHPHSIFSYSKNERERLVRSWVAPHGRTVHLEIGGKQVLAASTDILENRWYHLCLSWENEAGRYGLWVNGELWAGGRSDETVGRKISSGGDIVLGQEYTDFDKGLEDGIEGSVFGFNLLLASAFDPPGEASYDSPQRPSASGYLVLPLFARIPANLMQRGIDYGRRTRTRYAYLPISDRHRYAASSSLAERNSGETNSSLRGIRNELSNMEVQPLGLRLVKLSYVRCELGRGSPFIGGPLLLISWTRTPVRIFGGATVKNAYGECGNF